MEQLLDEISEQLEIVLKKYRENPTPELLAKANKLRREFAELDAKLEKRL